LSLLTVTPSAYADHSLAAPSAYADHSLAAPSAYADHSVDAPSAYADHSLAAPSAYASRISRYVPSRNLRSSTQNLLVQPPTRLVSTTKSFSYSAPHVWNSLPESVKL